jgi:hypothetical protein
MKCPTSFSLSDTLFRKVWEIHGLAIFETSHLGGGPLFAVGPDDLDSIKHSARYRIFDSWQDALAFLSDS